MDFEKIIKALKEAKISEELPPEKYKDPFKVLVAAFLSTRTKDEITEQATKNLFKVINKPEDLLKLDVEQIEKLIYPVGFYKVKARRLKELTEQICREFNGKVPDNIKDLMKLKGVGRKVANVVLAYAFNKDVIAVDTHVHRIANRLGIVNTKTPEETEEALKKVVPRKFWKDINRIFVNFGKKICKPIRPNCEACPIRKFCNYAKENNL